jgi:hypothetical protein
MRRADHVSDVPALIHLREVVLGIFSNRGLETGASRRRKDRPASGFPAGFVEQLEVRGMLSGIGIAVVPPVAPLSTDSAIVIAPPPLTTATTASTPVLPPVVRETLRIFMPPQVRAGVPINVTAIAVDASGRQMSSFNGSATVTSSDPAANLPMIEFMFRNGRASFQVSLATAGQQSITVTSLGDTPVSGTASTRVAAQPTVSSFLVAMPPRVVAGTPVHASIVALDSARRPVPGYSGVATLSGSDPAATLPESVTFINGRATARVTFATAGVQSLSVRGGARGEIAGTIMITVTAVPVAARFAVTLPRAVPAGMPVTVTLLALDAEGRPVRSHSGTATLTSTDAAATLPATVTFVNGRATVRVVFATLGQQTLSALQETPSAPSGTIVGSGTTQVGEVTIQSKR